MVKRGEWKKKGKEVTVVSQKGEHTGNRKRGKEWGKE